MLCKFWAVTTLTSNFLHSCEVKFLMEFKNSIKNWLLIWEFVRNLPLKTIIYWVTDQPPETHLKDLSNFQVLKYHYSAAQWALSKKMCKLKIIQLQSMSDVTFFVYQVSIKGLLSRIVYHVSIKGLLSRIVVYGVWPWYSAQAIQQWQPCPANKKLVQGCDMQRVFFDRSIQTRG